MHKLVTHEGETVTGVDFGKLKTLKLKHDRQQLGNRYCYVIGTAPKQEGEYTYSVQIRKADGSTVIEQVTFVVDAFLQSPAPMMGWLTWNWFARSISHDRMVEIARGMERHGLVKAGYNTIVLDDAWAKPTTEKAELTYDPEKFPAGISGLKNAIQAVNPELKLGIYSDAGCMTCENYQPGSYLFEAQHLNLFNSWGVDMLKYDFCNSEASSVVSYTRMGDEVKKLNAQRKQAGGIPFVLNVCEWGKTSPWLWAAKAGGSSWRATADAREAWVGNHDLPGVLGGVDDVRQLWMYGGVNRFNDLDMMCIGLHGLGGPSNYTVDHTQNGGVIQGLTDAQARTQMSLWCMLASPLALTCDLREHPQGEANSDVIVPQNLITAADIETLTNPEILAINQDALGQQAEYMEQLSTGAEKYAAKGYDVFVKDLSHGRFAVSVTNRSEARMEGITLRLSDLYMKAGKKYTCHEVWSGKTIKVKDTLQTEALEPCETKVYVLN